MPENPAYAEVDDEGRLRIPKATLMAIGLVPGNLVIFRVERNAIRVVPASIREKEG